MGEQTINSNTEGITTHILAEVAINRVKTHQSNTLAEVAINQATGRNRPLAEIAIKRDKTNQSTIWKKSPSIKAQAEVAI